MKHVFRFLALVFVCITVHVHAQTNCSEVATLSTDSKWGGGDVQGSILIGNTYGAGQGPGIYVVADGGYRLYLNGELLAWDNAAGRVRFIPMTFLPGKNAISVVGVNGADAPGVLIHIDELEKPYTSSASWKVNATPTDNTWKTKNFNDASWANVSVQSNGTLTKTPSGLSFTGFPAISTAKWIWSSNAANSNVVMRYIFSIKAVGFGEATTGGDGGTVIIVKTAAELVSACQTAGAQIILVPEGTLDCRNYKKQSVCRQSCSDKLSNGGYNGDWITNGATCPGTTVDVIRHDQLIWMNSNKTIIGMGRGASLRGAAFYANAGGVRTNMIFRNLAIWDVNPHIIEAGDAISINSASKLWVDHCSFKWVTDGNDIDGTTQCTFSWNHWDGYNNFACSGRDHYTAMIRGSDITFDHDFWDGASGRVPKTYGTLNTRIHMINNYHYDNTYYATESGGPNLLVYVENTHYEKVRFPTVRLDGGVMYCSGNLYMTIENHMGANWKATTEPKDASAKFNVPYSYSLDQVKDVKTIVTTRSGIGAQWGKMPTYTDVAGFSNTGPSVSISAPANGASFINPSSITITANATDAGGSISKVEFYSGGILIGTKTSSPYSITLTQFGSCDFSVVAVATDNSGIKTMSLPVVYTVYAQPQSYVYQSLTTDVWATTSNWTPVGVPAAMDTAIIRTGEVKLDADFGGTVKVEPNGIFRITANVAVPEVRLQGGTLKSYTSNPLFAINAHVNVEKASTIMAGSVAVSIFEIAGTMQGSSNLTKTSVGVLKLNTDASAYSGNWNVTEGTLQIANAKSISTKNNIVLTNASTLDIAVSASVGKMVVGDGKLILTGNLLANKCSINGAMLRAGTYTVADYPSIISGTGTLTVTVGPDCAGTEDGTAYIDFCGNCVDGTTGKTACATTKQQAEDICSFDGTVDANNLGYEGAGFVNITNAIGAKAVVYIVSSQAITVSLGIQYANNGTSDRNGKVLINGTETIASVPFPSTGAWTAYKSIKVELNLRKGYNKIEFVANTADGLPNLDFFEFIADASFAACPVTQTIALNKGWNLISTNVHPTDSSVAKLFNGLSVVEIKNMDAFWHIGQPTYLNALQTITAGVGYLVNMNVAGTLTIMGSPIVETQNSVFLHDGWNLIGCPYQTATPLNATAGSTAGIFGSTFSVIKNFEGFWLLNGTTNSIENIEPGKGYYLLK